MKLKKEGKRIMKKIIKLGTIIFCMMIAIVNTNVQAYTVDTEARASIVFYQKLPYHYEGEEKGNYKKLSYKSGTTLYFLQRNQTSVMTLFTNVEKRKDDIIEGILENGYPAKTIEELGVTTSNEAYFATQEAIFAHLEHKDINRYIPENEEGKRILTCAKNILEKAKQKEVILKEIDKDWKVDGSDASRRYKQYNITLSSDIENARIVVENGEDVIIMNEENQTVTTVRNGDTIKILVPKGMNQEFQVKLVYEKFGTEVYNIYHTSNTNLQYLLAVQERVSRQKEFDVSFQNLAPVTIANYTYETKEPMEGSVFTISDHFNKPIRENLVTDENGEIHTFLEKGEYLLTQTKVKDGYSPSGQLLNFEINELKEVKLTVLNIKQTNEETKQEQTQTNVVKEDKNVVQTDVENITNIHQTNIEKEITKQTNETNLEEKNEFINTIYKKNVNYATRNNVYENKIWKETVTNSILPGRNQTTYLSKEEYQAYTNRIKTAKIDVPVLPVAVKK